MAFIIVQHMDPTHKSGLVNILVPLYSTKSFRDCRWGSSTARTYLYNPSKQRLGYFRRKTPTDGTYRTTWS